MIYDIGLFPLENLAEGGITDADLIKLCSGIEVVQASGGKVIDHKHLVPGFQTGIRHM